MSRQTLAPARAGAPDAQPRPGMPPGLAVPPWRALAEPASVFAHPAEVLRAPCLSRDQKRAVLASWASDAWAVESAPELRQGPGGAVPLDDVLGALRALDGDGDGGPRPRRVLSWPPRPGRPPWRRVRAEARAP